MKVARYLLTVMASMAVLAACQDHTGPETETDEDTITSNEGNENTEADNGVSDEAEAGDDDTPESDMSASEEIEKTDNDSLNKVIEQADKVESYEAVVNLSASIDDDAPAELDAEVSFIDGNPPSMHLSSEGEDRTISKDGNFYFYTGEEWVNATESVSAESLFFVTYENTVRSIAEISDSLQVDEGDDYTTFTYEGSNIDVYNAFEELFKVSFGTVTTTGVESELRVEVDENDMIHSIAYTASGEDDEGTFYLEGHTEFMTFNNVEEIEVPEDAVEE